MSDEPNNTPAPELSPPPEPAREGDQLVEASKGFSEGQRGINIVNVAPVLDVPDPGGLPPPGDAPGGGLGDTPSMLFNPPADAAPPPAPSEE
jgi:hypothetical protein